MKTQFIYTLLIIISLNSFSCKKAGKKFTSFTDDDEIITITSDDEILLLLAVDELNEKGGTIFIDTPVITMKEYSSFTIEGNLPGGIIGIRQPNGEYPRIHFGNNFIFQELFAGINIYGSNKFIEYMIIESSINYGIAVVGHSNIFDHVITRYNYGTGFLVYGNFNSFNYCYSYRNCDASITSISADGFKISGEQNNVFNYCFSWDNSNSGFNYARILNSSDLSYLHSGSWNNGNVNVFTGKYDYDNGYPLDKNMWTIQEIINSDENFVSNYYNKKFNIDNAKIQRRSVKEWISLVHPKMTGDGFIFGNRNSTQSIDVKRNSMYNVAFDHKNGGFIDDFNHKYNAYITNCVAFNNGINYKLPYTLSKWSNNWSWNGKNNDKLNGNVELKQPANLNSAQRSFYSVRDQIIRSVNANMFPDGINFDSAINGLRE